MSFIRPESRPLLALILAAACWGLGTVVSKAAVEEIPPLQLLVVQLAASLVALILVMAWRRIPVRDPRMPAVLGRLGLLNPGLAYGLSLLGLSQITASLSVLLWAVEPILIVILAGIVLGERVGPRFVALTAVALAGMTLVIVEPGISGSLVGIALTLAGVACCAVYSVVSRRWLGEVDVTAPVVVTQQAYALAAAVAVGVGLIVFGGWDVTSASMGAWVSAVVSGVMYYAAAYLAYLGALRHLPASTAASSFYLIPVFGVAGGIVFLGDSLTVGQWIGAGLTLVAVAGILRARPIDAVGAVGATT